MWRFCFDKILSFQGAGSFIYAIAFLLTFSIPPVASASLNSSLKGIIVDSDTGVPIENAEIHLLNTLFASSSYSGGHYTVVNIPSGTYDISITADGYRDTVINNVIIHPDIPRNLEITLTANIQHLGKITVKASRNRMDPSRTIVIDREKIKASEARDIPELLKSVEGVVIQEAGPGGESQIRIRGGMPEHVLVLVDGQKLNGSGTGVADLRAIPIEAVESIEIQKGGASSEYGPGALAGVVNIFTRPEKSDENISYQIESSWGRWNESQYSLTMVNPVNFSKLTTRLSYRRENFTGDYPFSYTSSGTGAYDTLHTDRRINNDHHVENFFLSGMYHLSPAWFVNFSGQAYRSENGLPGQATRQNEFARAEDDRVITSMGLYRESRSNRYKLELGYSRFHQEFHDTLTEPAALQYSSEYLNRIYNLRYTQRHELLSDYFLLLGAEYRRDIFIHDDLYRPDFSMGRSSRDNAGLFLENEKTLALSFFPYFDHLNLSVKARYDYARTEKDSTSWMDTTGTSKTEHFSPQFGIALGGGTEFAMTIRANYGKSFRLPELNALFWRGDIRASGNPGLKPEKAEHSEAGVDFKSDLGWIVMKSGFTYFHNNITDMILWQPNFQGVWTPQNIASARITGHEEYIESSLFDQTLVLRYQNSVTDAINRSGGHNTIGNRLTLFPEYITNLSARFNYEIFRAIYEIRLVGKVFTNSANTRYYDGYRLDDLSLGLTIGINHTWKFETYLKIDNLRSIDYVLLSSYPMPEQNRRFGFSISYNPKPPKSNR